MDVFCKATPKWKPSFNPSNNNKNKYSKRTSPNKKQRYLPKTLNLKTSSFSPLQPCEPLSQLELQTEYDQSHALPHQRKSMRRCTSLLAQTLHQNQKLMSLLDKLEKEGSDPLHLLRDDGDWSKDHFWAVVKYLRNVSRSSEILQVFDRWMNMERSRINEFNYEKIVVLLGEEGLMEEAAIAFQEMKNCGFVPSLGVYNSIIHGYARKGNFENVQSCLDEMKQINLVPDTETYDGLIQAYGIYNMYDEIGDCIKKMEAIGCSPDQLTYNLLIREFARGGLVSRMERMHQTLLSKQMDVQPSTLVAMLEAYASFGSIEKMEKTFRRVLSSKTTLEDNLVRKLASAYIETHMFSRLDVMGLDLTLRAGKTNLIWCLRLLSHACLLSRKGMDSIVGGMEASKVPWNITFANIILLAYLRMKDFTHLRELLYELPARNLKPDMVTFGVLFDSIGVGFNGTGTLNAWRKMGFLAAAVEMNTDPLVLAAFGKGHFLKSCEEVYSALSPEAREKETWTYHSLIDLAFRNSSTNLS